MDFTCRDSQIIKQRIISKLFINILHLFISTWGMLLLMGSYDVGLSVVQWWRTGLLANRSNRSCTSGKIQNKIYLICPGCPRPRIALQCRMVA